LLRTVFLPKNKLRGCGQSCWVLLLLQQRPKHPGGPIIHPNHEWPSAAHTDTKSRANATFASSYPAHANTQTNTHACTSERFLL
jgi:hypothetical protein